jgi:DNA repair exonuclease SbcCD ATPase subunit
MVFNWTKLLGTKKSKVEKILDKKLKPKKEIKGYEYSPDKLYQEIIKTQHFASSAITELESRIEKRMQPKGSLTSLKKSWAQDFLTLVEKMDTLNLKVDGFDSRMRAIEKELQGLSTLEVEARALKEQLAAIVHNAKKKFNEILADFNERDRRQGALNVLSERLTKIEHNIASSFTIRHGGVVLLDNKRSDQHG